ncbi:MAG: hypothetical protein SPI86_08050 [Treponemataceae bacterium]|nr:hypothetical protein [Treponemataceae bacterium]
MKRHYIILGMIVCVFLLLGCPNQVLPTPTYTNSQDSSVSFSDTQYWGSPTNVTASNGLKGRIELSWEGVKSAYRYYIYESTSPINGNWIQCGETNSSTYSFTIDDCQAGADKYYRITSVKKNGTESSPSLTVHGTSLACPYITSVEEGTESDSMSVVEWWMSNVSDETYLSSVRYTVYCALQNGTVVATQSVSGAKTSQTTATFTGLTPHTSYNYYVEAYNIIEQNEVEVSDISNAETARRTRPEAPTELSASKGLVADKITLTFTTPIKCEQLVNGQYEEQPLYFKIYRKIHGSSDDWTRLPDFLPYPAKSGNAPQGVQYFENETADPNDDEYEEGKIITYTDNAAVGPGDATALLQGYQYDYKVQAYVYFTATYGNTNDKAVSSDYSIAETTGHLISKPSVTLNKNSSSYGYLRTSDKQIVEETDACETKYYRNYYDEQNRKPVDPEELKGMTEAELSQITSVYEVKDGYEYFVTDTTLQCNLTFETFGLDNLYKYVVKQDFYQQVLDGEGNATYPKKTLTIYRVFDTLNSLNQTDYSIPAGIYPQYDADAALAGKWAALDWQGMYKYTGYIVPADYVHDITQEAPVKLLVGKNEDGYIPAPAPVPLTAAALTQNTDDSFKGPDQENILAEAVLKTSVYVSSSAKRPEIEEWKITNGYKDKLTFSWKYDDEVTYSIYEIKDDGTFEEVVSAVDLESTIDGVSSGTIIEYDLAKESGYSGTYELHASKGITVTSQPLIGQTLGTATPEFSTTNIDYKTVTVTWEPVNKADNYTIRASYYGDGGTELSYREITGLTSESEGVSQTSTGKLSYTINDPAFDDDTNTIDAQYAGKNLVIAITSNNTSTSDATKGTVNTYTLGPANTNLATSSGNLANKNGIYVSWSVIEGAKGYWVSRERLDFDGGYFSGVNIKNDGYYVSADGSIIKNADGESVSDYVTIKLNNGKLTLFDKYKPMTTEGSWALHQDYIAWGYPFSYTVYPLKSGSDSFTFEELTTSTSTTHGNGILGDLKYENVYQVSKTGNALGYGINVKATKSNDPRNVTITFDAPLNQGSASPVLKYREAGSTGKWSSSDAVKDSSNKFVVQLTGSNRTKAFEYAVDYSGRKLDIENEKENLLPSYVAKLQTTPDTDASCSADTIDSVESSGNYYEALNKGYAFAIDISMGHLGTSSSTSSAEITEFITLTPWDYQTRALGPDSNYTFQIKNLNHGTSYASIVDLDKDTYEISSENNKSSENKVIVTKDGNSVKFMPDFTKEDISVYETNSIHTGILEVLRDYKHYGKVLVSRNALINDSTETIFASYSDVDAYNKEKEISSYRGLTKAELGRCISLVVCDALLQCGCPYSGNNTINGQTGYFKTTHEDLTYTFGWGTDSTSYRHIFTGGVCTDKKNEAFTSPFTISASQKSSRAACGGFGIGSSSAANNLYYVTSNTLTVTSEIEDASYQGSVSFEAGEMGGTGFIAQFDGTTTSWVTSIKVGNETFGVTQSDKKTFKYWTPLDIGSTYSKQSSYSSSWSVYSGEFWH